MGKHGPPKGLLRGDKFNKRHSTIIPAAQKILWALRERPEVRKVALGQIVPVGNGQPRLKFKPIPAGLVLIVRGTNNQQMFFVYTGKPTETEAAINEVWSKS